MNAEAYLEQLNKLDRLVQNTRTEIEHWQEVAASCTVNMDSERVQSSGPARRMENAVVTYSDLQAELKETIRRAEVKRQEILAFAFEHLLADQYDVIYHIYAQGMMLKEVEIKMHRSRSWVSKTHRAAIKNLQKALNQESKHDKQTDICKEAELGQNSGEIYSDFRNPE